MKHGYILLYLGLIIIFFSALSMVMVFANKMDPISYYSGDDLKLDFSSLMPQYELPQIPGLPEDLQPKTVQPESNSGAFSSEMLTDSFNLFIHIFLMGFLVNVGFKLAVIGAQLVRPIQVKMPQTPVQSSIQ